MVESYVSLNQLAQELGTDRSLIRRGVLNWGIRPRLRKTEDSGARLTQAVTRAEADTVKRLHREEQDAMRRENEERVKGITFTRQTFHAKAMLIARRPNENGFRVSYVHYGEPFDETRFRLVPNGWDHEHCRVCCDHPARGRVVGGHAARLGRDWLVSGVSCPHLWEVMTLEVSGQHPDFGPAASREGVSMGTWRIVVVVVLVIVAEARAGEQPGYAIVVSEATRKEPAWNEVVEALVKKHTARVVPYVKDVKEVLPALRQQFPRYACFVARPEEVTREFVVAVHRLTRQLDDDPYTDCLWGILTGPDAATALRIARQREPLTVRRVAAGTEVALDMCEEGVWYCELKQGRTVRKEKGGKPTEGQGPKDTTEALAKTLTEGGADLFVTSGHATERDWQIGYSYRNGQFRSAAGQMYGVDTSGRKIPIRSDRVRVYLPVGNCLMGHIDGPDAMALAWMKSAGVTQMIGYTVPTWYGYAGWGCLDTFVEQPGRFTLAEAFFANQHALVHRLKTYFPEMSQADVSGRRAMPKLSEAAKAAGLTGQDGLGLAFDRDVVAFYGDPAWEARMAPGPLAWEQSLTRQGDRFVLEIRPKRGADTFRPINRNGSQRGGRPVMYYLPDRVRDVEVLEGNELRPVVTDDFVLVPLPQGQDVRAAYRVVFRARPAK